MRHDRTGSMARRYHSAAWRAERLLDVAGRRTRLPPVHAPEVGWEIDHQLFCVFPG